MKYDAKNGSLKIGEYKYSIDKKTLKKVHRKKARYKTKVIPIIISILILILIFYPLDFKRTVGIKNFTADDILSISLYQTIQIPKGMGIEAEKISMYDIADEIEKLRPLPLSKYSESYLISKENITDKSFIEEVLLTLADHKMRKRRFSRDVDTFHVNHTMPRSTSISIFLNDENKTQIDIFISHDPRYINIYKFNGTNKTIDRARYKIYGDGINTQKLFDIIREFP